MDFNALFIGLFLGFAVGAALVYFYLKSSQVARDAYEQLNQAHINIEADLRNALTKTAELKQHLSQEQTENLARQQRLDDLRNTLAIVTAEHNSLQTQFRQEHERLEKLTDQLSSVQSEKEHLFARNAELSAVNENLTASLEKNKEEIAKMQELAKNEFQNLANKILEEKSEKFTALNQNNLKNILEPFQEKITELRHKVGETYDKESKERFSLGERVKELALLNQQISEDARKLTRALKGESKTQGNWGEMILESILEKSGLVKGREYFLEHELRDEDNKALYSEFSGKKMRPDAVVKYPDERNVIIDSKVSLTAFTELVDESDAEIYDIKIGQHVHSIKTHIRQLSDKAYDDYDKSLDFVMMFIPSESAYIAAMQAEPNLWNFAYDKRILLLNPSNLITSLKLVSDLWKREYQNRNATEIAERGAKLYDKFVGFVDNLEKLGRNIDQAKNAYNEAFKQLSTGNDNLVIQTTKLKNLGIKNKKTLPQSLTESAESMVDSVE